MSGSVSALSPDRIHDLTAVYRDGLLQDVVPFWMKHGVDKEHGGIMTSLDRDGTVIDTDKGLWQQGRFAWLMATLHHDVGARDDWHSAAESTINYLRRAGFDRDDHMYFQATREGKPLRKRRYVFTESFAAIALGAWARISGDEQARDEAIEMYQLFRDFNTTPGWIKPKMDPGTRPSQGIGPNMILINTCQVLRDTIGYEEADAHIEEAIHTIEKYFVKRDWQAVMETVGPLHDVGLKVNDVQEYWHDMKFWWPHNEATIATLLAYALTGNDKYAAMHTQVHDWSHQHFPDREHGEWFGYLHRDGRLSVPLKGNLWKGAFHIPRMQWYCWRLCEQMLAREGGKSLAPVKF